MAEDIAALAAGKHTAGIRHAHRHALQAIQQALAGCRVTRYGQRLPHHAKACSHVDGAQSRAVQLGWRFHHQVGQLDERNHLIHIGKHFRRRARLVDGGALHAHQHVCLEQRAAAEGHRHRAAIAQQHALVERTPHRFGGVEALLHGGIGQSGLVACQRASHAGQLLLPLGAGAGRAGGIEIGGRVGRGAVRQIVDEPLFDLGIAKAGGRCGRRLRNGRCRRRLGGTAAQRQQAGARNQQGEGEGMAQDGHSGFPGVVDPENSRKLPRTGLSATTLRKRGAAWPYGKHIYNTK